MQFPGNTNIFNIFDDMNRKINYQDDDRKIKILNENYNDSKTLQEEKSYSSFLSRLLPEKNSSTSITQQPNYKKQQTNFPVYYNPNIRNKQTNNITLNKRPIPINKFKSTLSSTNSNNNNDLKMSTIITKNEEKCDAKKTMMLPPKPVIVKKNTSFIDLHDVDKKNKTIDKLPSIVNIDNKKELLQQLEKHETTDKLQSMINNKKELLKQIELEKNEITDKLLFIINSDKKELLQQIELEKKETADKLPFIINNNKKELLQQIELEKKETTDKLLFIINNNKKELLQQGELEKNELTNKISLIVNDNKKELFLLQRQIETYKTEIDNLQSIINADKESLLQQSEKNYQDIFLNPNCCVYFGDKNTTGTWRMRQIIYNNEVNDSRIVFECLMPNKSYMVCYDICNPELSSNVETSSSNFETDTEQENINNDNDNNDDSVSDSNDDNNEKSIENVILPKQTSSDNDNDIIHQCEEIIDNNILSEIEFSNVSSVFNDGNYII